MSEIIKVLALSLVFGVGVFSIYWAGVKVFGKFQKGLLEYSLLVAFVVLLLLWCAQQF